MELLIGVAQLDNCLSWAKNFQRAKQIINKFSKEGVDLVCFQEAYLSGYAKKIFSKDFQKIDLYVDSISEYAKKKNICVVLPTIEQRGKRFYSSAYLINTESGDKVFYKQGLTDSEKIVMHSKRGTRKFKVKDIEIGILMCREVEDHPQKYFKKTYPDLVLWPSYWGWSYRVKWGSLDSKGEKYLPYYNLKRLSRPVIQVNMSSTFNKNLEVEKYGKSLILNSDASKKDALKYGREELAIILFSKLNNKIRKIKSL